MRCHQRKLFVINFSKAARPLVSSSLLMCVVTATTSLPPLTPRQRQVHEIEPGYSRGDFALPGHVGFITEVRGMHPIYCTALQQANDFPLAVVFQPCQRLVWLS